MTENYYSLADLRAAVDNDGGFGGGNSMWWIVVLFLIFERERKNKENDYGQYATAASQQEILYGQQFGQLNDRLTNLGDGICNLGYEMQGNVAQLGKEVALGQSGLGQTIMETGNSIQRQLADCCCENRLAMAMRQTLPPQNHRHGTGLDLLHLQFLRQILLPLQSCSGGKVDADRCPSWAYGRNNGDYSPQR